MGFQNLPAYDEKCADEECDMYTHYEDEPLTVHVKMSRHVAIEPPQLSYWSLCNNTLTHCSMLQHARVQTWKVYRMDQNQTDFNR